MCACVTLLSVFISGCFLLSVLLLGVTIYCGLFWAVVSIIIVQMQMTAVLCDSSKLTLLFFNLLAPVNVRFTSWCLILWCLVTDVDVLEQFFWD